MAYYIENRPAYRAVQTVWFLLNILEILLLFRFFLRLFGANPLSGFTNFIYTVSYPFVSPFINVFRVSTVGGQVFEWTTLLAMFVYWIIALVIVRLILIGRPISRPEAAARLRDEDEDQ